MVLRHEAVSGMRMVEKSLYGPYAREHAKGATCRQLDKLIGLDYIPTECLCWGVDKLPVRVYYSNKTGLLCFHRRQGGVRTFRN